MFRWHFLGRLRLNGWLHNVAPDVLKCICVCSHPNHRDVEKNTHHFPVMLAGSSWTELKVDSS